MTDNAKLELAVGDDLPKRRAHAFVVWTAAICNAIGLAYGAVQMSSLELGTIRWPHVFLTAFCACNLVALVLSRRSLVERLFLRLWALVFVFVLPVAFWFVLGVVLFAADVGLGSRDVTQEEVAGAVLAALGVVTTFAGIGVRHYWRPAWWQSALAVPLFAFLSLACLSMPVMRWLEELLYGPMPSEFGASLSWSIDNGDLSERLIPLVLVVWLGYFLVGAAWAIRAMPTGAQLSDAKADLTPI